MWRLQEELERDKALVEAIVAREEEEDRAAAERQHMSRARAAEFMQEQRAVREHQKQQAKLEELEEDRRLKLALHCIKSRAILFLAVQAKTASL